MPFIYDQKTTMATHTHQKNHAPPMQYMPQINKKKPEKSHVTGWTRVLTGYAQKSPGVSLQTTTKSHYDSAR